MLENRPQNSSDIAPTFLCTTSICVMSPPCMDFLSGAWDRQLTADKSPRWFAKAVHKSEIQPEIDAILKQKGLQLFFTLSKVIRVGMKRNGQCEARRWLEEARREIMSRKNVESHPDTLFVNTADSTKPIFYDYSRACTVEGEDTSCLPSRNFLWNHPGFYKNFANF